MKYFLAAAIFLSFVQANAAQQLKCRTEKTEVDPTDTTFTATDSNQRIAMDLYETVLFGIPVLASRTPQTLNYEFSQSTGGVSPWSLVVSKALVHDENIQLEIVLLKNRTTFYRGSLNLKVYKPNGADSQVAIFNKLLSEQILVYNPTQGQIQEILLNFEKHVRQGRLKKNDLAWLLVANCRLVETKRRHK